MNEKIPWIPFYQNLADKLNEYKDKRGELFEIIKSLSEQQPLVGYFHFENEEWWGSPKNQIDPLSVMGMINRGISIQNRILLAKQLAQIFDVDESIPTEFNGIPILNNQKSFFAGVDEIWDLFSEALKCSEHDDFSDEFKIAFDNAIVKNGNGVTTITMGLFWIRPNTFMPLDKNSRAFIASNYNMPVPDSNCTGDEYVAFLRKLKNKMDSNLSFQEISYAAWLEKNVDKKEISGNSFCQDPEEFGEKNMKHDALDKNIILYGTPGTGKTYSSIIYAVAIVEEKNLEEVRSENYDDVFERYLKYKEAGLIAFTTFHQSFSYEEFIEGIRPVVYSEERSDKPKSIEYEVHDGVFKKFCDKAGTPIKTGESLDLGLGKNPSVWKVSLEGTGDNPTRRECLKNGHIRIGFDSYGSVITDETDYSTDGGVAVINAFYNRMQIGDIIMSCFSSKTVDAIGIVVGEPEWHDEYPKYKRLRKVNWLVKNIEEDIVDLNAGKTMTLSTVYALSVTVSDALQIVKKYNPAVFNEKVKVPNRVFIIDEINRGNISKIFGELITLIEPSKRINAKEQLRATLPYSGQNFGVPQNVYIVGTMNTADRSIALIDTALRRRFSFVEMKPDYSVLKDVLVEGISVSTMLEIMNKRITILLDREHTIGHSYLLSLKDNPSLIDMANIFKNRIVPLLQEYFYDDYQKIQLVLGDDQKQDKNTCFIVEKDDFINLFNDADINISSYYEVNEQAFFMIDAYAYIQ